MKEFKINSEYIKLGQLLKATGEVSSGVEAKITIQNGSVKVNGEVEERRGKKIIANDIVEIIDGESYKIIGE